MQRRAKRILTIVVAIAIFIAGAAAFFLLRERSAEREAVVDAKPDAPPDLEKLRPAFNAGIEALQRGDGAEAVKQFESFSFGSRAVEEYRLYFLAQGHQLTGRAVPARRALSSLWEKKPRMVGWDEIGLRLASAYAKEGDWSRASAIATSVADRSGVPATAASARWSALQSAFASGQIPTMVDSARRIATSSPRAEQAADSIDIMRAFAGVAEGSPVRLTDAERLQRGVALMRDGDPQHALEELTALESSGVRGDLRLPVQLNRGLALHQLRRYEDSNRVLEPLSSSYYKFAIPALYTASKNYRIVSDSINPIVTKTITVRQKVGTVKVKPKGKKKAVTRPKYANVKKNVQLVDLPKKQKKENYARLSTERLKDLLSLPLANEVRIEVLNSLIAIAEAKNQDAYEKELILQLAKVNPAQDAGLQHFWDKGWAAYSRGDLNGAKAHFTFIRDTYTNPNVRRQSQYWYARTIERLGQREEAAEIYRDLAAAPYADLYAIYSVNRGAPRTEDKTNPLKVKRDDWHDIAEREMPRELRLAYELTALADYRDARVEIQKNAKLSNAMYGDALLADLYNSAGNTLLMMRALRRAFPKLATVEQDSVPQYFIRMYYPIKYENAIAENAKKNGLDRYVIQGLIHQESYYNPRARSSVGATGLMQLMPATGKEVARRIRSSSSNLEDPITNVKLGTFYFRTLVDMFGSVNLAIASYNAGMGNVAKWRRAAPKRPMDEFLESMPFSETRNYVKRVNMLAASYRRLDQ